MQSLWSLMVFALFLSSALSTGQQIAGVLKDDSLLAILMVSREGSALREFRNDVLFFIITEKTLSSMTFECGRKKNCFGHVTFSTKFMATSP